MDNRCPIFRKLSDVDQGQPFIDSSISMNCKCSGTSIKARGNLANLRRNTRFRIKSGVNNSSVTMLQSCLLYTSTTTFNELLGLSRVMAEVAREVIVMVESDKIGRRIPNLELPWSLSLIHI